MAVKLGMLLLLDHHLQATSEADDMDACAWCDSTGWRCSRCKAERATAHPSQPAHHVARSKAAVAPRKFLRYVSSRWERLWLENIYDWQDGRICDALASQRAQLNAFMNATCSARTDTKWCLLDDTVQQLWWHTETGEVSKSKPGSVLEVGPIRAVHPDDPAIFSWLEFEEQDGAVVAEYIEPLVGHLRHPQMGCPIPGEALCSQNGKVVSCLNAAVPGKAFKIDRSFLVPPPRARGEAAYYFDAGASNWKEGPGGPSLSYFTEVWARHGVAFDHIYAYEGSTSAEAFYATVPDEYRPRTHFKQQWIASSAAEHGAPFMPSVIRQTVRREDYVLFKLDIDNNNGEGAEAGTIDHLLDHSNNNDLDYIDELVWEHHVMNYIMAPWWEHTQDKNMSIGDSYQYFLRLRHRGVRAHSWV